MEHRDLLELLYTAHNRFTSVQLAWEYQYHVDTMNKAINRWTAQYPPGSGLPLASPSKFQGKEEMKVRERLWWQKPSDWRSEYQIEGQETSIKIIREDCFWFYNPGNDTLLTNVKGKENSAHFRTHKSKSPMVTYASVQEAINDVPFVDPSFLLSSHELQPLDSTTHAERDALRVRAIFRKGKESNRFWSAADEYELLVDKERGILLRYTAKLKGQEFALASVDLVIFDELIPKSIFSFTPSSHTSVQSVE